MVQRSQYKPRRKYPNAPHYYSTVWTSEEPSRAGGRAYSVRDVSRLGHLFRFVHQSATAITLQKTRSWTSAVKLHRPETNNGPQHVWHWVQHAVVAYIVGVSTYSENNTRCRLPIVKVGGEVGTALFYWKQGFWSNQHTKDRRIETPCRTQRYEEKSKHFLVITKEWKNEVRTAFCEVWSDIGSALAKDFRNSSRKEV